MIDTIHQEGNLYQAAAVQMGWCQSGCDLKHSNPDLYRLSKAATLGLGYSMGAAKFVDTCKSQGLELAPRAVAGVDKGMVLGMGIVFGVIASVMAAAAFFAGQSGLCDDARGVDHVA